MSLVGDKYAAATTNGTDKKNSLQAVLVSGGQDSDLQAVLVPVAYDITVQQAPGSSLTIEQARALAITLGLELYEPA